MGRRRQSAQRREVSSDSSIVLEDNPDGSGVNVYKSVYDHIYTPEGGPLTTISLRMTTALPRQPATQ